MRHKTCFVAALVSVVDCPSTLIPNAPTKIARIAKVSIIIATIRLVLVCVVIGSPSLDLLLSYLLICELTIDQDHRFVKKKVRASQCFRSFHTAERTLEGIEAVNMIRKGQVKRLSGSDAMGQAKFVMSLFQFAA